MWQQVVIPSPLIIIPVLVITTQCHTPKDNPGVVVINSKHVEVEQLSAGNTNAKPISVELSTEPMPISKAADFKQKLKAEIQSSTEDNVFIPTEREVTRVEDYWREEDDKLTIHDLMKDEQKISDIMKGKQVKPETEKPEGDIIFINGKHDDNFEEPKKRVEKKREKHTENTYKQHPEAKKKMTKLDCTNLYCENNVQTVCGGKLEGSRQWRYRLFMNECYFRKVNCYFRNKDNRYQEVPLDNCKNLGPHGLQSLDYQYQPTRSKSENTNAKLMETRRMSSRRSMTMSLEGRLCSHACPGSCTEHYEPVCAVSGAGRVRVFMNHCKMDWNSCSYNVVWHMRPLADCVGGKKADMNQNSGFINWMQSVGIVDNKGKLVLH